MELWHDPESLEWYSKKKTLVNVEDMKNTGKNSNLTKFVHYIKSLGFNGLSFFGNHDNYPDAIKSFSKYLKENGIDLFIIRYWDEFEKGWAGPRSEPAKKGYSKKYCPFSPELRQYWKQRIEKDYKMIGNLAGYKINGTEYYANMGAPWMCDCDICGKLTKKERTIEAINFISEILKPYNGTLFWEACQDDPDGMRLETELFGDMTDLIPENANIIIKDTYWDYHPDWPRHSAFYTIKKDKNGSSPYLTSIQLAGEYRGHTFFPYSMVYKWSSVFKDMQSTGQKGPWVMAMANPETIDHTLNMVNWYSISRYIENPSEDPDLIMKDWAEISFSRQASGPIIKIIEKITAANRNVLYHRGLWTQCHSEFFDLPYLESHLCGPYRCTDAIDGYLGLELPLDMYSSQKQEFIRNESSLKCAFGRVKITEEMAQEAVKEKERAVSLIDECIEILKSIKDILDKDIFLNLMDGLEKNRNDALLWKLAIELYLDLKLGRLTEKKIDKALNMARGLEGALMKEPLRDFKSEQDSSQNVDTASFLTFANELRQELQSPWLKEYLETNKPGL